MKKNHNLFFCVVLFFLAKLESGMISVNNQLVVVRGTMCGEKIAVTGTVRFVSSLQDCNAVQEGDIIVAFMTQDSWLGAIEKCAGIITELGDSSCHAALCGKLYNIPVLVGAQGATKKLANGDYICLDCSRSVSAGVVYNVHNDPIITTTKKVTALSPINDFSCHSSVIVYPNENYNRAQAIQTNNTIESARPEYRGTIIHSHDTIQRMFKIHQKSFIEYVEKMKNDLWWGRCAGEAVMLAGARLTHQLDDLALACIPISYDFFDKNNSYLESILKTIDIKDLVGLFRRCTEKPAHINHLNWVAHISHEEHIEAIPLPSGVNKADLKKDPSRYKKLIDQKRVDQKRCHQLIAAGLFVRYCVEKNIVSI